MTIMPEILHEPNVGIETGMRARSRCLRSHLRTHEQIHMSGGCLRLPFTRML